MPQSTKSIPQLNSFLRVVGEEEPPPYDAVPSPKLAGGFAMNTSQEPFVQTGKAIGETIMGTLGTAAFGVYWHLSKRAKNGQCWPSLDDIAEGTMLSRMHVTRMLKALEEAGWITREKRANSFGMSTSTLYTLIEKPRTNGCNIPVTSREHDDPSDVTRTRRKREQNEKEQESTRESSNSAKSKRPAYTDEFRVFMRAYPAKGRGSFSDAFKIWLTLDAEDRADAIAAIPKFVAGKDWQEGFQPGPEVWLRGRRWENPPVPYRATVANEHPNAARHGKWVG